MRSEPSVDGYRDSVVQKPAVQKVLTKNYTEEAVAFIKANRDQPFFLYVPYSMPHTPIFPGDDFSGRSLGGRYGDVIEELDWSVGVIANTLESLQLADNTLLVFTSDNGPWLWMQTHGGSAGLLRNGKGTTFEGGMRVPAVFSWPGRIKPGVVSEIGSAMDLYATAASLAGVDHSTAVDAYDLTPALIAGEPSPRDTLFYYRSGELQALRKGRYKISFVTQGVYGLPPERVEHEQPLLFDLRVDPGESYDIAAGHPEVVAQLIREKEQHQKALKEKAPIFDARLEH